MQSLHLPPHVSRRVYIVLLPEKSTKYIAIWLPTAILANLIVTGLVGLISVDLLYAWYRKGCKERLLNDFLEK
ncbi:3600_t:CDS:2 [Acaulospora morrowiae]|uniref:3600_t:CDS:1 n=1 Tax=Acaulospora morrowiae TaxID=94023 RepID=A0A9N9D635_9GLOM|nr:3600_t:CDS:2 [Acaulospora morrowiae]